MTAGEVRKLLEGVPDEAPLLLYDHQGQYLREWGGGFSLAEVAPNASSIGMWVPMGHPAQRVRGPLRGAAASEWGVHLPAVLVWP